MSGDSDRLAPERPARSRVGFLRRLAEDVRVVREKDPAATSTAEVLLYPHLHAIWMYRLAHAAYRRRFRLLARAVSMSARLLSGSIEIHPGASLGRRLFVDHGAGVVIGETAEIGNDVMLYHGVTLGSVGWWRDLARGPAGKRHPTIGDRVVVGTGASVLGPVVVGAGSKVGAHAVILTDLPPGSRIPPGAVVGKDTTPGAATPDRAPADVTTAGVTAADMAASDVTTAHMATADVTTAAADGRRRPPPTGGPSPANGLSPSNGPSPSNRPSPSKGAAPVSPPNGSSHTSGQVLITCAPPNPNGDLHLGHLSGPFLGADVLRRYLAARQVPVMYVSYTDDESCYVPRRAAEIGMTPRETALRFTRRIEQTLAMADMQPDYYAHPHREPRHQHTVQQQFLRLHRAGLIDQRRLPTPYCEHCERFLYEADLRGRCRFCHLPCDGTYCEDCGFPQDPQGVDEPRCVRCGSVPVLRPTDRLVVPLARYSRQLKGLYERRDWPRRVGTFCTELLAYGLPDVPISRVSGYGVPVPLPGWEGHILDTWFSGIYGYMAATDGLGNALGEPGLGERVWQDEDTTLVHFIGFDCSFSHAVLWPAQLLAAGAPALPRHIVSNEFYHLEGEKFSTSRGHAIWGSDFLRETPADALRFYLSRTNPETEPASFSRAEFGDYVDDFLADRLESWACAVFDLSRERGRAVAEVAVADRPAPVRQAAEQLPRAVSDALEPATFSLRRAAQAIVTAVEWSAGDLRAARTSSMVDDRLLAGHVELLATVAAVAAPLMPNWSSRVWDQLGLDRPATAALPWPEPGRPLVPPGTVASGPYRPFLSSN